MERRGGPSRNERRDGLPACLETVRPGLQALGWEMTLAICEAKNKQLDSGGILLMHRESSAKDHFCHLMPSGAIRTPVCLSAPFKLLCF